MPYKNLKTFKEYQTWYRKENREKLRLDSNAYYKKNREKIRQKVRERDAKGFRRERALKELYNLTLEDYDKMNEAQEGKCAICRCENNQKGRRLPVDHNHVTGKVRKLLCNGCNTGLGHFKEDPDLLSAAAEYLKEFSNGT